jgi:hypothetical protein
MTRFTLGKARRELYRGARILGNVEAVERSIERGSPAPLVKARRAAAAWRFRRPAAREADAMMRWRVCRNRS